MNIITKSSSAVLKSTSHTRTHSLSVVCYQTKSASERSTLKIMPHVAASYVHINVFRTINTNHFRCDARTQQTYHCVHGHRQPSSGVRATLIPSHTQTVSIVFFLYSKQTLGNIWHLRVCMNDARQRCCASISHVFCQNTRTYLPKRSILRGLYALLCLPSFL